MFDARAKYQADKKRSLPSTALHWSGAVEAGTDMTGKPGSDPGGVSSEPRTCSWRTWPVTHPSPEI